MRPPYLYKLQTLKLGAELFAHVLLCCPLMWVTMAEVLFIIRKVPAIKNKLNTHPATLAINNIRRPLISTKYMGINVHMKWMAK